MKRFLTAVLGITALFIATPSKADISHQLSTSIKLTVDAAASQTTRIPSVYTVSGSNISLDTAGGLSALTAGSGVGYTPADYSIVTAGDAFSFSESYIEGDSIASGTTVTSGVVGTLPTAGQMTTTAGGVAGALAGSISSDGTFSITAGGAGTSALGQFTSTILVD